MSRPFYGRYYLVNNNKQLKRFQAQYVRWIWLKRQRDLSRRPQLMPTVIGDKPRGLDRQNLRFWVYYVDQTWSISRAKCLRSCQNINTAPSTVITPISNKHIHIMTSTNSQVRALHRHWLTAKCSPVVAIERQKIAWKFGINASRLPKSNRKLLQQTSL